MSAAETEIRTERRGAVLVLTLYGPPTRNAVTAQNYDRIAAEIIDAGRDPNLRAVVLTGAGGFFCSGADIRGLQASRAGTLAQATARTDRLNAMIRAIHDSPLPVIAAIEGGVAGAGMALALACDMITAAKGARFTVAHVRIGLSPDGGVTWFLRRALPRQLVIEMCTLARPVSAETLARHGLVNAVTEPGGALAGALALADQLARGPAGAIAMIKHQIGAAIVNDLPPHLELEARDVNRARFGPEAAEGFAAFLEERPADFSR